MDQALPVQVLPRPAPHPPCSDWEAVLPVETTLDISRAPQPGDQLPLALPAPAASQLQLQLALASPVDPALPVETTPDIPRASQPMDQLAAGTAAAETPAAAATAATAAAAATAAPSNAEKAGAPGRQKAADGRPTLAVPTQTESGPLEVGGEEWRRRFARWPPGAEADVARPSGHWQFYELFNIKGHGKGKRKGSKAAKGSGKVDIATMPPPETCSGDHLGAVARRSSGPSSA